MLLTIINSITCVIVNKHIFGKIMLLFFPKTYLKHWKNVLIQNPINYNYAGNYRTYTNLLNKHIVKLLYCKNIFDSTDHNPIDTNIKKIYVILNIKTTLSIIKNLENIILYQQGEISQNFNNFFSKISNKLVIKIKSFLLVVYLSRNLESWIPTNAGARKTNSS